VPRLNFIIDGRDMLSRVLDRAGNASARLGRRLLTTSINGEAAMNRLARTTTDRLAGLERDSDAGAKALESLTGAAASLAPAAIPAAAALAPIAAGAGAAAVASATFAAALIPQISAMSEAAEAEKKYDSAVKKSGRTSEQAITAQREYLSAVQSMPPETRKAAAALGILKDQHKAWSDSLASDTTPVFTKGLAVVGALMPKTAGLVKGTSVELDRMVTIVAGGMQSPGFDNLNEKFTQFATGTLRKVNDGLLNLGRSDKSKVGGALSEFMTYAREQGPVVGDTLGNIAQALLHVLDAGADAGVGMLDIVNALSGIVAAVPPGAIAALLQLALAIKAVKLAAAGMVAARAAIAGVAVQLVAMRTAAAAAPGRLGAVTAAIGAMSKGAKLAMAGTGIGLLILGLMQLSSMGKKTPPDVDKLTTSLGKLGTTGKVSGEAARAYGKDLGGLGDSLRVLARPSNAEGVQQWMTKLIGMDSTPVKQAKQDLDGVDKALANLVSSGKPELARQAFDQVAASMRKQGMSSGELKAQLGDYKSALANADFEAKLIAQSMGLFGTQAGEVQKKLDAQKASADGLRQSIQALNDVNRASLGGMIGFEGAIDAAAEAAKKNAGALTMSGGTLNLNSEKARTAASALSDLAAKTDEAAGSARESGASWSTVNGIYSRGREKLLASAQAMGLTKSQARALAAQILKTPDKTARLKGNLEDLQSKLGSAKRQLKSVPDSRRAKLLATISDLQAKVNAAKRSIAGVRGKTVGIMVQYRNDHSGLSPFAKSIGAGYASGGRPRAGELAWVGEEGPELMRHAGGTEIYDHRSSMRMAADASAAGRDAGLGLRRGMSVSTGEVGAGGKALGAAVLQGIRDELEIASPSKKTKALAADAGRGLIVGMTGSKAKISATAKDLVKDIWAAWKGSKSTKDSRLVTMVNRDTKKLQGLASKRDSLASRIAAAKKYSTEVRDSARQGSELGSLGLAEEDVTAGSIKAGLAGKLAQVKQFTSYVKTLAKRGLDPALLRQILNMSPDAGYAYASALVSADKATFGAINKTQRALGTATTTLGNIGADAMYDSGSKAGKGFLTGLSSQQKAIEAQMVKIAKGMQTALRRALGIRSPARKLVPDGANATRGLAVGLIAGIPFLDQALAAVSGRVTATKPALGVASAVATRADGAGMTVNIRVDGAMDPVAVAQQIQKLLLKLKRSQGLNVDLLEVTA
jgi:trimeric autotransporter adhesin